MKKQKSILWVVIYLVILGVVVLGYMYKDSWKNFYKTQNKDDIAVQNQYDTENLPEGVEIVERDGKRVLRDEGNGYELKIEDEWTVFSPANVVNISLKKDLSSVESAESFFVYRNDSSSNDLSKEVNFWLERQNDICEDCYKLNEIIEYNGLQIAIVEDLVALGDYKNYLFFKNNYVYNISSVNISLEKIKSIIDDINFEI